MDDIFKQFILSSYELLQNYEKSGRYFHTLTPQDNSPTVVHHKTNQLTYIISGKGTIILNGEEDLLEPGKFIFIKAGDTHRFIATSEELILYHIHMPDEGRDIDRFIVEGDDYNRYK